MKPIEHQFLDLRRSLVEADQKTTASILDGLEQHTVELSDEQRARIEVARCYVSRDGDDAAELAKRLDAARDHAVSDPEWHCAWNIVRASICIRNQDASRAEALISEGLSVSKATNDVPAEARCMYLAAMLATQSDSSLSSQLAKLQEALGLFQRAGSSIGECHCLYAVGAAYASLQEWNLALQYLARALDLAEKLGSQLLQSQVLNVLGRTYNDMGEFEQALVYYERALGHLDTSQPSISLFQVISSISWLYSSLQDHERALEKNTELFELGQQLGNRPLQLDALRSRGTLFNRAEQWESSIEVITSIYDEVVEEDNLRAILHVTRILANAYNGVGSYELSLKFANEYLSRRPKDVDVTAACAIELLELRVQNNLGNTEGLPERVDALIAEMTSTSQPLRHNHENEVLEQAQRFNIELAEQLGNYEKALRLYKEFEQFKYSAQVEEKRRHIEASEADRNLAVERERAEQLRLRAQQERGLLSRMLPDQIADRMLSGSTMIADAHEDVSVLFLDIVSFTEVASQATPHQLIHLLSAVFTVCDAVIERHGLTKIKTIGDAYMAAAGVPEPLADHVVCTALAATELLTELSQLKVVIPEELGDRSWLDQIGPLKVRVGVHTGPLVAGVIDGHRIAYDIWGDAVNIAARMESTSEAGRIHASSAFADAIPGIGDLVIESGKVVRRSELFLFRMRGEVEVKGKGVMTTYWLEGA